MKKRLLTPAAAFLLVSVFFAGASALAAYRVGAPAQDTGYQTAPYVARPLAEYLASVPFQMPAVALADTFRGKTVSIQDFGAIPDGKTLCTEAFAKAIEACVGAGGGTIMVPAGTWLTGPIVLKSHIHLELSKGALVQFSRDHSLYPIIEHGGHNGGYSPVSPLYGYQLEDVSITGEGVLDGGGDSWRPVKKIKTTPGQWQALIASGGVLSKDKSIWWPSAEALGGADYLAALKGRSALSAADYLPARDYMRPCMVYLAGCSRVLLQGVTFRNSPMFVLYPNHCTDLMLDRINVYNDWWAQNGDGIDISACKRVILYRCTVNAGDDGICMKSSGGGSGGRDSAVEAAPALENVVIAGCTVFRAHGGFVIGSNTDGGMRNVYVTECNYIGTDIGIRVKSNAGRGGLVHDIYVDRIYMKSIVHEAVSFDTYYEDAPAGSDPNKKTSPIDGKTPIFRDFFLSRIYCEGAAKAISITGLPQMPVSRIFFDNVYIRAAQGTTTKDAADISMKDVKIDAP